MHAWVYQQTQVVTLKAMEFHGSYQQFERISWPGFLRARIEIGLLWLWLKFCQVREKTSKAQSAISTKAAPERKEKAYKATIDDLFRSAMHSSGSTLQIKWRR